MERATWNRSRSAKGLLAAIGLCAMVALGVMGITLTAAQDHSVPSADSTTTAPYPTSPTAMTTWQAVPAVTTTPTSVVPN
jgi:heme/copper-type cytochrome/quinol oxidase subunit 2